MEEPEGSFMKRVKDVNMDFTEFWYLGKPAERREYLSRKRRLDEDRKAQALLEEMKKNKRMKERKKRRKRNRRFPRPPRYRFGI